MRTRKMRPCGGSSFCCPRRESAPFTAFAANWPGENFYKLHIPQDFRICDDSEMEVLRGEAAGEVLDAFHEEQDSVFQELSEAFSPRPGRRPPAENPAAAL